MKQAVLAVCLVLPSLAAGAAAEEPRRAKLLEKDGRIVESYQPDVGVSGNVIAGVMRSSAASALAEDRVGIALRSTVTAGEVCLRAVSRDGAYASRNAYQLPIAPEGSLVLLPYETKHKERLRAFGDRELAITATHGSCSGRAETFFVVTAGQPKPDDEIHIFVNSFGATDVLLSLRQGDEWSVPLSCDFISEGRRTTYDHTCRLSPGQVQADGLRLRVIRERYGREQPEVEFRVIGSR